MNNYVQDGKKEGILRQIDLAVISVHFGDMSDTDFLGTGGFALIGIGAITETFFVHLSDHI